MEESKQIRFECIAYHNWVSSLNKEGFPKNEDGSPMNCWQLYDHYITLTEKRNIYRHHAIVLEVNT